jgi:hypothetical protein
MFAGNVNDITDLFTVAGKPEGESNLKQGSVLPSDQSMVILVLRVLLHFYAPEARSAETLDSSLGQNGDYYITAAHEAAAVALLDGSVPGDYHDVHRLYMQASEQLLWDFGAGEKFSLKSMPSSYFPWGGGLAGDVGGATDLVYWNNGTPDHAGVLRLGRAITLPPRQNVTCQAKVQRLPDGSNAATFGANQGARVMHDLKSNLNAVDLIHKTVAFCFDGLFSRDVQ